MSNGVLVTRDGRGRQIRTELLLSSISTDLQLQISEGQNKRGVSRRPIRMQERFLTFRALYPASRPRRFEADMLAIQAHWRRNLAQGVGTPMRLHYLPGRGAVSNHQGGAHVYEGWIDSYTREYAWNDVLWEREFRMRLMTQRGGGAVFSKRRLNAPYIPHLGDLGELGPNWFTRRALEKLASSGTLNDGSKPKHDGDGNTHGEGSAGQGHDDEAHGQGPR